MSRSSECCPQSNPINLWIEAHKKASELTDSLFCGIGAFKTPNHIHSKSENFGILDAIVKLHNPANIEKTRCAQKSLTE